MLQEKVLVAALIEVRVQRVMRTHHVGYPMLTRMKRSIDWWKVSFQFLTNVSKGVIIPTYHPKCGVHIKVNSYCLGYCSGIRHSKPKQFSQRSPSSTAKNSGYALSLNSARRICTKPALSSSAANPLKSHIQRC